MNLSQMSATFGTSEEALRLFISLLMSYPICMLYSNKLVKRSVNAKHAYYLLSGVLLVYFNYGFQVYHSLITCLFSYATIRLIGNFHAVFINTLFNMTYLLVGCHARQLDSNYSICWTLTQCVLTLRLIATTFDVYDGLKINQLKKADSDAKVANEDTAVTQCPSLLAFLSHCYFPGTIIVGPLVSYQHYVKYINSNVSHLSRCWHICLSRFTLGIAYLAVYQIGTIYWPPEYLTSEQFSSYTLLHKLTAIAIVVKVSMSKYLMSWLISEGACIASGVSWDGESYYYCTNIYIAKFELTPTFGGIIKSFNLTTNNFAFRYVFKRLKFLNNRALSQALTLTYLAIWHGIETGYMVTFMLEFLVMNLETGVLYRIDKLRKKYPLLDTILNNIITRCLIFLVFRIYTFYLLGYCMVPFVLLKYHIWYPVYREVYFYGHVITLSWVLFSFFI